MEKQNSEIIDAIDNDDTAELMQVMQAKRTVAAALNRKNLIEILREIVDASECLEFISKRAKKFISPSRPELLLQLVDDSVAKRYPAQYEQMRIKDIDIQHSARKDIVKSEISDVIVDFFTAVFMYIKNGTIPANYASQAERVQRITDGTDLNVLRDSINNLFNKKNKDGTVSDELGFIFSVITSVSFPAEEEVFTDNSVFVEIVY